MPVVSDLGSFAPTATVSVPFATLNPWGGSEVWSGLAYLVRPDGQATEAGIGSTFGADGRNVFTVNLPRAELQEGPGWLIAGRYRVVLYGDPLPPEEEIQGVTAAVFDVTGPV